MGKPKIFVIGFQRSGTTLTRKLIERHPDVYRIFHEKRVIMKPAFSRIKKRYKDEVWGDKVPWNSSTGSEVIRQGKKWTKEFGEDHRIVHVMRNPKGSAQSNVRLGWLSAHGLEKIIETSVVNVHNALKQFNYMAFRLEDLTSNPAEILAQIYSFCGLIVTDDIIDIAVKGDPTSTKKSERGVEKQNLPPYKGYKELI